MARVKSADASRDRLHRVLHVTQAPINGGCLAESATSIPLRTCNCYCPDAHNACNILCCVSCAPPRGCGLSPKQDSSRRGWSQTTSHRTLDHAQACLSPSPSPSSPSLLARCTRQHGRGTDLRRPDLALGSAGSYVSPSSVSVLLGFLIPYLLRRPCARVFPSQPL